MYKHNNFDALGLVYFSNAICKCDNILIRHLEWVKMGQISKRLTLDYSNTKDWTGDPVVGNVNLVRDWKIGLHEFQRAVVKIDVNFEINALEKSEVTLKKPNQRLVGVSLPKIIA